MPSAARSDCGHISGGPNGWVDQLKSRVRSAISLEPARKLMGSKEET
jgi:hypothetical protein